MNNISHSPQHHCHLLVPPSFTNSNLSPWAIATTTTTTAVIRRRRLPTGGHHDCRPHHRHHMYATHRHTVRHRRLHGPIPAGTAQLHTVTSDPTTTTSTSEPQPCQPAAPTPTPPLTRATVHRQAQLHAARAGSRPRIRASRRRSRCIRLWLSWHDRPTRFSKSRSAFQRHASQRNCSPTCSLLHQRLRLTQVRSDPQLKLCHVHL